MTRGTANMLSVGSDRRIRCCGEVNKLLDEVNLHPAMEMDSVEDTVMPDADDVIPDEGARSTVSAIVGSLGAAASGAILIRSSLSLQLAECASDDPGTNSSLSAALIGSSTSNLFQINVGSNVNTAGYGYRGALVSSVVLVLGAAILLSVAVVVKHCIERCHQPSHAVTWRTLTSESGLPGWWLVTCWALRSGRRAAPLRCGFPGQRLAMGCGHRCRGRRPSRGVATALVCAGSLVFQGVASAQASWLVHSGATRPCTRVATCAARCAVATGRGLRVGTGPPSAHRRQPPLRACVRVAVHVDVAAPPLVAPGGHEHELCGWLAGRAAFACRSPRADAATLVPAVCTGALHVATALQLLFFFAYVAAWPAAIRWENTTSLTNAFLGALGALLMSLAFSLACLLSRIKFKRRCASEDVRDHCCEYC